MHWTVLDPCQMSWQFAAGSSCIQPPFWVAFLDGHACGLAWMRAQRGTLEGDWEPMGVPW